MLIHSSNSKISKGRKPCIIWMESEENAGPFSRSAKGVFVRLSSLQSQQTSAFVLFYHYP